MKNIILILWKLYMSSEAQKTLCELNLNLSAREDKTILKFINSHMSLQTTVCNYTYLALMNWGHNNRSIIK
jgi:hypothetical protein